MYARGILFGKMKYELGDHSYVRCPENNFVADLEFKTKGYFSGTYNAIGGSIRNEETGEVYYELSGLWNGEMFIKDVAVRLTIVDLWEYIELLIYILDWSKRTPFQRNKCQAHSTPVKASRRARRARIAKAMEQNCRGALRKKSRFSHRRKDQGGRTAACRGGTESR